MNPTNHLHAHVKSISNNLSIDSICSLQAIHQLQKVFEKSRTQAQFINLLTIHVQCTLFSLLIISSIKESLDLITYLICNSINFWSSIHYEQFMTLWISFQYGLNENVNHQYEIIDECVMQLSIEIAFSTRQQKISLRYIVLHFRKLWITH